MRYFLFAREFGIKPSELDQMTLGDIAILEYGLEQLADEVAEAERPGSTEPTPARAEMPGTRTQPLTPAEDRAMAIQQYEQEQASLQPSEAGQTSAQKLASMGITVNSDR